MANRKKPADKKFDVPVQVRVPSALKADLEEMANATGISTSERARRCFESEIRAWRKSQSPS